MEDPKDAIGHEAGRAMVQGVAKSSQRCRGGSCVGDAVIACIVKELFKKRPWFWLIKLFEKMNTIGKEGNKKEKCPITNTHCPLYSTPIVSEI